MDKSKRAYFISRSKETEIHYQDNETGGYRALLAGVLWRALADLTDPIAVQNHRREALAWFRNKTCLEFSFLYCCEHLNLCHKKILREVNRITQSPAFAEARKRPQKKSDMLRVLK